MIGFAGVKDYVHRLEEVSPGPGRGARPRRGSLDGLLQGATALRHAVEASCAAGREACDLAPEQAALVALIGSAFAGPGPAEPAASPAPTAPDRCAADDATLAPARSTMVRVDFSRLDHLLNLVGELIVARTSSTSWPGGSPTSFPGQGRSCSRPSPGRRGVDAAAGDDHGRADAPHPPRLRALPRSCATFRATAGEAGGARPPGRGHPRRQGGGSDELGEPLVHLIRNA